MKNKIILLSVVIICGVHAGEMGKMKINYVVNQNEQIPVQSEQVLEAIVVEKSSKKRKQEPSKKSYVCVYEDPVTKKICGKSFPNWHSLKTHKKTLHENKPQVPCPDPNCDRTFGSNSECYHHFRTTHSTDSKKLFMCECSYGTNRQDDFYRHKEYQHGNCRYCNKSMWNSPLTYEERDKKRKQHYDECSVKRRKIEKILSK